MKEYIMALKIFQESNERFHHQLDAELIEKLLNEHLYSLHVGYIHDKLGNGFSYTLSFKIYLRKYSKQSDSSEKAKVNYDVSLDIIEHLMDRHFQQVLLHFKSNTPSSNYCDLMKETIFFEMVQNNKALKEFGHDHKTGTVVLYKKLSAASVKPNSEQAVSNPFDCSLTISQREAVVNFCNAHNLFNCIINLQDLNDFFSCKPGFCLQPKKNSSVANLLGALSDAAFICGTWQNIIETKNLLLSSTGKSYLNHRSLASDSSLFRNTKNKKPKDQAIVELIQKLKDM